MFANITNLAMINDALRLAGISPNVSQDFKDVIQQDFEIAEIGVISRLPSFIRLFERIRDGWADRKAEENFEKKLAYIVGCLVNKAANEAVQRIPVEEGLKSAVYRDAYIFREIYGSGRDGNPSAEDVEEFFKVLAIRGIIALHTFQPGLDNSDWVKRLLCLWENFYADLPSFAEAFTNPDPGKAKRYITDVNFYDSKDAIIQIVRSTPRDQPKEWATVETALRLAEEQSVYSRGVTMGYKYLAAADQFFQKRISKQQLLDIIGIH